MLQAGERLHNVSLDNTRKHRIEIGTFPFCSPLTLKPKFKGLGKLQHIEINKRIQKQDLNRTFA